MRKILIVALFAALCSPARGADTPMFRGDLDHTGVYDSPPVAQAAHVKWAFHTRGYVNSSPVVANSVVYVGSADDNMYALDETTGKSLWHFKTGSRVVSSPAIWRSAVYFGSYDGNFYALSANDGKLLWKFKTGGERRFEGTHLHGSQPVDETMPDPFDVYLSSPAIWHETVYFGSGDGHVYALNAKTGEKLWSFKTGDIVHASPAIDNGTLFVGSWDSYFYALDALSGKMRWRFKTGVDPDIHNQVGIQSSAAVMDGTVFFGCRDSHLYALDEQTGDKKWSLDMHGSWVIGSPAVRDGKVYFATSDSGLFYAVNAGDGSIVFSEDFHGWPEFASPAVAGDMLYLGSWRGVLTAIDLTKRQTAWSFQTDASKRLGPDLTKADGSPNYAPAYASDFYDDLITGFARMMTVGAFLSSPAIDDGVIFVGSTDGNVYALD
ncbi:MAG TPA: PQQ-binding-like beta-propeller repeat protein [Candidatus Eremiobacteraceae bacterium]|nr:PQQ-binding-like beta-propeller repeat protein [Candidatus Eremiobacteraceae bacterium]